MVKSEGENLKKALIIVVGKGTINYYKNIVI